MNQFSHISANEARRLHFDLLEMDWKDYERAGFETPTFERVICICGSTRTPRQLFVKHRTPFVRCPDCTTVFVNPQLTEAALNDHFATSPAWEAWSHVLLDPAQMAFDRQKYEASLDEITQYVPKGGRLLDVGANSGVFLSVARSRGWTVSGVEPSRAACAVARREFGIELFQGTFKEFPETGAPYELITFWASLEYTKNPRDTLRRAIRMLAPGGYLLAFISGNPHSLVMRMLQERCIGFLFNRPWYIPPLGLDALTRDLGVKLVSRRSILPSLDVIERHLDYSEPYGVEEAQVFDAIARAELTSAIERNHMGYKYQSIYRLDSHG